MAEFDIAAHITAAMKNYSVEVAEAVDQAVDDCAKGLKKELQQTSPKGKTGAYAKGWRTRVTEQKGPGNKEVTVYNETNYQLTHLLEKPHLARGRKKTVPARPHIAPANDHWQEEFTKRCEEACKT